MIKVPCKNNENVFRSERCTFSEVSLFKYTTDLTLFMKQGKLYEEFLCKYYCIHK